MRLIIAILFLAGASLASAQSADQTYWLFMQDDGHTWCAYSDSTEFKSVVGKLNPRPQKSALVTYSSGRLTELTEQFTPESGDWIVIDTYTPKGREVTLQRTNLLTQQDRKIIQKTAIRGNRVEPLRIDSVMTLQGQRAEAPAGVDLPEVAVSTSVYDAIHADRF